MNRFVSWYNGLSPRLIRIALFSFGGFAWSSFATSYLHFDLGEVFVVAFVALVVAIKLEGSER